MPDRVYPTTEQNLGSEKEFNGIRMDTLAACLAEVREAGKMPSDILEKFKAMNGKGSKKDAEGKDEDKEKESSAKRSKKELPKAFLDHIKGKKDKDDDEDDDCDDDSMVKRGKESCDCGECPECLKRARKASNTRVRRVAFVKPEQLSADAVIAAKEAGDEPLVQAIIAERQNRRMRLASKLLDDTKSQIEKQQNIAKRNAFRMRVIAKTQETRKVLASSVKLSVKTAKSNDTKGFKTVTTMNDAEKNEFVRKVVASGFPREYALAMLGNSVSELTPAEKAIRDVMASNVPEATKRVALSSMVKEAKLDAEQVARQLKYWKEDLGYGDKKWVDDLFSTAYDN